MSIENTSKYPLFDLAAKHLLEGVVVRTKPEIDLIKKPTANSGVKLGNLGFDMYNPAKEIFEKGLGQREDDR